MNYTNNQHRITTTAYEGYGVYEFNVPGHWDTPNSGMSQFPGMPTGMPSAAEAITIQGGIQVIKSQYRDTAIGLLDQTTFQFDDPSALNAPTITGQASVIFGTIGSGWASDYLSKGYAILAEIATIEGGAPRIILTTDAQTIAQNAASAAGGDHVVVAAPDALLGAAQTLVAGPLPSNGPVAPVPPTNGREPAKAAVAPSPSWLLPAVIGVGVLTLVAVVAVSRKRK